MNLGPPVFKVLGFANERDRVKVSFTNPMKFLTDEPCVQRVEEQNKLLLADYDPKKFIFRARDRSKEIHPDMRFKAAHRDNMPRAKTPKAYPRIK